MFKHCAKDSDSGIIITCQRGRTLKRLVARYGGRNWIFCHSYGKRFGIER